jgi:hypothetical protein
MKYNDNLKVCDNGLILIIKLLCWTLYIVLGKFEIIRSLGG